MPAQKSWMHGAAYEILTSPGANIDAVVAIIAKHCPFKPDVAYQVVPPVAPKPEVSTKLS